MLGSFLLLISERSRIWSMDLDPEQGAAQRIRGQRADQDGHRHPDTDEPLQPDERPGQPDLWRRASDLQVFTLHSSENRSMVTFAMGNSPGRAVRFPMGDDQAVVRRVIG